MSRGGGTLFETVRTEGGLLPPDLLKRIADGDKDLPGLTPEEYHLFEGERLGEATSRAWNRVLGAWASFRETCESLGPEAPDAGITRERWLGILFQELGYGRLEAAPRATSFEGSEKTYPISHYWQRSPIHLVGFRTDLDTRTKGVAGAARQSPHSLVQEFLNRSDDHLWGIVSNGLRLRLLRDNVSLIRQAFVEFDLEAMLEGEAYSDFALLWLVAHESRLEPRAAEVDSVARPEGCWLETWMRIAEDSGTRAREQLRVGVERAIAGLGRGFLAHRNNAPLREALRTGELTREDYYRELLRLVYRLLFLFTAEDRQLLLLPQGDATSQARRRYEEHYSARRLRWLAERRRGSPHSDLYRGLRLVMERLGDDHGCPELALPALGSFLWSESAITHLAKADLANRHLLEAVRALAFTEAQGRLRPVDYRNLGSEELGSIYESLLELHPEVDAGAATFELRSAAGHERKTTGSYYTPTSLIQCLLETALDPVLEVASAKDKPEEAILALKVCDPATGSGHFLIAAAHRIARRLAFVRTGEEDPAPAALRSALRDVIGHCLYGVDVNPMAVELCKVSLWLEALDPGKPLSFLDHHIQCGNSLLGATPALLARGIPDDAWKPIEGDDRKVATALRKQNRDERRGQKTLYADFVREAATAYGSLGEASAKVEALPDDSVAQVHEKEGRWRSLSESREARLERLRADAWCAAFVWPKRADGPEPPTFDLFLRLSEEQGSVPRATLEEIGRLAREYRLFHWHVAFPEVFRISEGNSTANGSTGWVGGFDVVLSNPPWERVKLQEREFFSSRRPDIANAPNAAARRRLIAQLAEEDQGLYREFVAARRMSEGESHLARNSGRYPLCGRGDVNTYAIFAELMRGTISPEGRVGCIVPTGIATDDTTKHFFGDLADSGALASLFDFQSGPGLFAEIGHARYKFCLLTLCGSSRTVPEAEFAFFLRSVDHLADPERRFVLSAEDIALLNPNTKTCPVFRTRRDAELTKAIYRQLPVLVCDGSPEANPWGLLIRRLFDMNKPEVLACCLTTEEGSPTQNLRMYEAKMFHQFCHRFGDYADRPADSESTALPDVALSRLENPAFTVTPRYWVPRPELEARLSGRWEHSWFIGWRDVTNSTNERTVIASALPLVATDFTIRTAVALREPERGYLVLAMLNSFAFDFLARQKVSGTHLSDYVMKQLPVLSPDELAGPAKWSASDQIDEWIFRRIIELVYTAFDLASFARDLGYEGPPFQWNEERRFLLRCELDAVFFHLYGMAKGDVEYIMETFPIVKRKDIQVHGDYRTKLVILDVYERLEDAMDTGEPYKSVLEPPPGDPRAAHPPAVEDRIR